MSSWLLLFLTVFLVYWPDLLLGLFCLFYILIYPSIYLSSQPYSTAHPQNSRFYTEPSYLISHIFPGDSFPPEKALDSSFVFRNNTIVCEYNAHLIWANVRCVLVTNIGSLIWAGMLSHALCICRQIINISLVPWPAHVALQLWTAMPFIIIMPWWSTRWHREKLISSKLSG